MESAKKKPQKMGVQVRFGGRPDAFSVRNGEHCYHGRAKPKLASAESKNQKQVHQAGASFTFSA
jgi:hypothetical protein